MSTHDRPATPATPADVDEICGALPRTWFGTSWGDVPTWLVVAKARSAAGEDKGRGFVLYRRPHHSAIDPATGEPYDDLLVVRTAGPGETQELLASGGPFFTVDHFRGYSAVLVQLSRLGEISRAELAEVITDAWAALAPASLVREHLG